MDFFGIGFGEILLIIILALIIFGPGRLPEIARTIGRVTRSLRKTTSDFTASLTKEIEATEKGQSPPPKAAGPPAIAPEGRRAGQDKASEPSPQPPDTAATNPPNNPPRDK